MAEYTKVTSFVDLAATEAEKEAFIKQIREIVDYVKAVGQGETRLKLATDMKTATKEIEAVKKAQEGLAASTKTLATNLEETNKASKGSASSSKELAAARKLEAQETKAAGEAAKTKAQLSKLAAQQATAEARATKEKNLAEKAANQATKEGNLAALASARAAKEKASAKLQEARTLKELYQGELAALKATTETNRAKLLEQKIIDGTLKQKDRLEKAALREAKVTEKLSNEYEQLKYKYKLAADTALQLGAAEGIQSQNFLLASAAAQKYYTQLVNLEDAVGRSQRKVGQYTNATFALTQVLREAPAFAISFQTGISAIGNNLPILVDQFKQLKQQVGSGFQAFKILAGGLFSFTALLPIAFLLIQSYGKEISDFFSRLVSGAKSIDKLKESQRLLNEAFQDSSYADAIKQVNELTINIGLAKEGFISKEKALKQYNETIGKTIGHAKTLDEAEQLLVKNGDAYIKMTLFKAAANLALEEAAKKALEAEQIRLNPEKALSFFEKLNLPFENAPSRKDQVKKFADPYIKDADKAVSALEGIAKDFQERAAKISKDFKFDFFGGQFEDKGKKKGTSTEDFAKDLAKQKADALKIQNEITRTRLEGEAAYLQAVAQKNRQLVQQKGESLEDFERRQAQSLSGQLDDYQAYYNKIEELNAFNTKAQLAELDQRTQEEKRAVQDQLNDKTQNLTKKQRADLQATLVAIDAKAAEEKKLIVVKANQELLAFDRQYESEVTGLTKEQLDERLKKRLEYFEKLRAQILKEKDFQNNNLTIVVSQELLALNEQLKRREITLKQYNERKLRLAKNAVSQEIDNEIAAMEQLLKATAKTEEERAEIEAKIAELRLKKDQELTDAKISNLERLKEAQKKLGEEALLTFSGFVTAGYEKEKNALQDLIDKNEEKRQQDIEIANATAANATQAAERVAVINARADAQKTALERKQRQVQQERARFERSVEAARIIGATTVGVMNALSGPPPLPPNPVLAAIIGATGALQLARLLSTPIPKYATGLDKALDDHYGIVGDGGRQELVRYPDGSGWITPATPTLTFLPKGSSVTKSLDEARSVYNVMAPGFTSSYTKPDNGMEFHTSALKKELRLTRKVIASKRETYISIVQGRVTMRTRDGYNETDYLNQNLNG